MLLWLILIPLGSRVKYISSRFFLSIVWSFTALTRLAFFTPVSNVEVHVWPPTFLANFVVMTYVEAR